MRTTVELDEGLIKEAMRVSKATTKKQTIELSLQEMVRRHKIEEFISRMGTFKLSMDLKDLEKLREDE